MQENEISLKELILLLFKGWKWIIGLTLVSLMISVFVLLTLNSTTYQLNLSGKIIKADNYDTVFGVYPAYTVKNSDLINLVNSNDFLKLITYDGRVINIVSNPNDSGEFTMTISSADSMDLVDVHNLINESFEGYVNFFLQNKAIEYFVNIQQVILDRNALTVIKNTQLLETLTQKLNSIERLIDPNVINPEYSVFSSQRAAVEFETIRLQLEIDEIESNLKKLEDYKSKDFDAYNKEKEYIDAVEVSANFDSINAIQEIHRFNTMTLIPISVILGGMIGVFLVFFSHFWKNN